MIPGRVSKLAEEFIALSTTINPRVEFVHVTDTTVTTVCATIVPPMVGGFSQFLVLVNRSGNAMNLVTTGNIAKAVTVPTNQATVLVYSKRTDDWYPGAIS